jgi:prepilin-type N-terminal cleavage/methylation domain-containing protein
MIVKMLTFSEERSKMTQSRTKGFSLLEMSVVIAIIATVMAFIVVTVPGYLQQQQLDNTKAKMQNLQTALEQYWKTYGRLPCPADIVNYNATDANFGKEATNPGSCDGAISSTWTYDVHSSAVTYCDYSTPGVNDHCLYGGMIPTKTLRLSDEDAFDSFGRRILYAVDSDFTRTNAATTLADVTADTKSDSPTQFNIKSAAGNKTLHGVWVLLSYGSDGHGAYPRYTTPGMDRITSGNTNLLTQENCDCDEQGAPPGPATGEPFNSIFYQEDFSINPNDPKDAFDDSVRYGTRETLHFP